MSERLPLEDRADIAYERYEEDLLRDPSIRLMREHACSLCGGPLFYLGPMGRLDWYRCRQCGADNYIEEE